MRALVAGVVALLSAAHAAAADSYTVPFETRFNIIVLKGSLNGQAGHVFLLNTGSSATSVTSEAAVKAGWARKRARKDLVPSIGVGGAVVEDLRVLVGDPPGLRAMRDHGVDYSGVLGHSFLERFVTTLDYQKQELTLVPAATAPDLAADKAESWLVPFRTTVGIMLVEGAINGQGPQTMVIGSANASTLLTPAAASKLGIKGRRKSQVEGEEVEAAIVESIAVGGAQVKNLAVLVRDQRAPRIGILAGEYDAVLGTTFLRHFRVTIDYRVNQVRFTAP